MTHLVCRFGHDCAAFKKHIHLSRLSITMYVCPVLFTAYTIPGGSPFLCPVPSIIHDPDTQPPIAVQCGRLHTCDWPSISSPPRPVQPPRRQNDLVWSTGKRPPCPSQSLWCCSTPRIEKRMRSIAAPLVVIPPERHAMHPQPHIIRSGVI